MSDEEHDLPEAICDKEFFQLTEIHSVIDAATTIQAWVYNSKASLSWLPVTVIAMVTRVTSIAMVTNCCYHGYC